MRLICPNCDAEYAVDDAAIPPQGRDVQCSNCGNAWFQMHPDAEAEAEAEAALSEPPAPRAEASSEQTVLAPAAQTAAAAPAPRRQLDESLMAVLREEAAREAAARRNESARTIESQPDLGLTEAVPPPRIEIEPAATDRPAARRDLLPDIEEINSTLRAARDPRSEADGENLAPPPPVRRGGFRAGFLSMLLAASVLVAGYVMAPRIAQYLPGAAGTMTAYVQTVDRARIWLDAMMQQATGILRGVSGDTG